MKFPILLLVGIQVLTIDTKSLSSDNSTQPCRKEDSDFNSCILKAIEKRLPQLSEGISDLNIPPLDPFSILYTTNKLDFNKVATGTLISKNIKCKDTLKLNIDDINLDLDNRIAEVNITNPNLRVSFDFEVHGKLFSSPINVEASVKAKLINVRTNVWAKLKTVKRDGKKYLSVDYFKVKMTMENGTIKLFSKDPRRQSLMNFIQNMFNGDSKNYLELANPITERNSEQYMGPMIEGFLTFISQEMVFPE